MSERNSEPVRPARSRPLPRVLDLHLVFPAPVRALLVGAAALGIELWLRRDSRFLATDPGAVAAYALLAWLLFTTVALGVQLVGAGLRALSAWAGRGKRAVPVVTVLADAAFLAAVATVPIGLEHVGLRYLIRPDGYTLGLLAGIGLTALGLALVAHVLSGGVDRRASTRVRSAIAAACVIATAITGAAVLESPRAKLVALQNTCFTGQLVSLIMFAGDLDRDGFPGGLVRGADPDDLDPDIHPYVATEAIDPRFGTLAPAAPHARPAVARFPNVILFTIDTFAYHHTGPAGYARATTPNLDALAGAGVWFERCFVPVAQSAPSYASILTGAHPYVHGMLAGDWMETPEVPFIWSALDSTYATLAFTFTRESHLVAGSSRFADGAQHHLAADDFEPEPEALYDWLATPRDRPFFAWLFSKALHAPHHLPAEMDTFVSAAPQPLSRFVSPRKRQVDARGTGRARMIDVYDGALRYVDDVVGRLWRFLEREGLAETTVLIVTGDHGEAFYDHDRFGHGQEVYDEHLHVPLLFVGGELVPGRTDALVSSLDIAPTIFDMAGLSPWPSFQGRSLLPGLRGGEIEPYPFLPAFGGYDTPGGAYYHKVAVRTEEWKLIWNPILDLVELYDLRRDPGELRNVVEDEPERRAELMSLLTRWGGFYPRERRP